VVTGPGGGAGAAGPHDRQRGLAREFEGAGLQPPYLIGRCLPDPSKRLMAGRALEVTGWDHSL
jgi:hypothetical protein